MIGRLSKIAGRLLAHSPRAMMKVEGGRIRYVAEAVPAPQKRSMGWLTAHRVRPERLSPSVGAGPISFTARPRGQSFNLLEIERRRLPALSNTAAIDYEAPPVVQVMTGGPHGARPKVGELRGQAKPKRKVGRPRKNR